MSGSDNVPWWQRQIARVFSQGPIPNHVAFILDGNRRWARDRQKKATDGHVEGSSTADNIMRFCWALKVREITLYLFSVENFKRDPAEVKMLMDMLVNKIKKADCEVPQAKFRIIGDTSMLSKEVREECKRLERDTVHKTELIINLAIAYGCRQDVTDAMKTLINKNECETVSQLEGNMYTAELSKVDLLIRSSGETRFSDFLQWECSETCLCFVKTLWPDMDYWDITKCIYKYQRFILSK